MTVYAKIGSLSSGTTVPHEVAWNLAYELRALARHDDDAERKARVEQALAAYEAVNAAGDDAGLTLFYEETAPALFEEYCPPYTYYRSVEGDDGLDITIVPDVESLSEAARYRDGVVGGEAGTVWGAQPEGIDFIMEVTDHGNVSLYDAHTGKEIWACV